LTDQIKHHDHKDRTNIRVKAIATIPGTSDKNRSVSSLNMGSI